VHRLVAAHRGLISIEDNHPTGAVFVVRLPIANST
jgi:signal transduction histidine kinase